MGGYLWLRWLVPALGCFVMVTSSLTDPPRRLTSSALSPIAGHVNNVPATTLEWTFGKPSSLRRGPLAHAETNTLPK